jgi:hypothetical protein
LGILRCGLLDLNKPLDRLLERTLGITIVLPRLACLQ